MKLALYDGDGLLTSVGNVLRVVALMAGLTSAVAVLPVGLFVLFSPMLCGAGCTAAEALAPQLVWLSLVLFIASAASGIIGFSNPSWASVLLAIVSPLVAVTPFAFVP